MSRKSIVVGTVVGRKNLQLYLQLSVAYTAVLKPAISGVVPSGHGEDYKEEEEKIDEEVGEEEE